MHAYTDANSCTTIAKAGKRRRRGGGGREEDAARAEGELTASQPWCRDARTAAARRCTYSRWLPRRLPPSRSPALPPGSPHPAALLQPPELCGAGTGQLSGAERIPSLRRPPPPAALRSPLRRWEGGRFRGGVGVGGSHRPLFPQPSAYQASLNPFISTVTIIRRPRPCLPTDSSRGPRTYWRRPGRRASRGERRAARTQPPAPGHGRPPPAAPPRPPPGGRGLPHWQRRGPSRPALC